ncbi:MAG: hypothetical protein IKD11_02270 [Oscillospiraceae bacterium]|nr:hypothetical protein [Oscillospiraceae bacterium]
MRVFLLSVSISALLSFLSEIVLEQTGFIIAVVVMMCFVGLGIVFDIIGVAVTAADTKPFFSMASHRTKGAKEAIWLINNANKVSSICNDVVGDICGIVSGTTGAVIVLELQQKFGLRALFVSIVVTALISGLTIGGKAVGKEIAMKKSKQVVYFVAKLIPSRLLGKKK